MTPTPAERLEAQLREWADRGLKVVDGLQLRGVIDLNYVLEHGKRFSGRVPSIKYQPRIDTYFRERVELGACFGNAGLAALFGVKEGIEYWEGYVFFGTWKLKDGGTLISPVEHAWNVIDGNVVDFTAEAVDAEVIRTLGKLKHRNPADCGYFGVRIPVDMLKGSRNLKKIRQPKLPTVQHIALEDNEKHMR